MSCPGDWTSDNDCCGICAVHRNDHEPTTHLSAPKPTDYVIGHRVRLRPATDLWMMGARYGTLEAVMAGWLHVRLDATGKLHRIWFQDVCEVFAPTPSL